MSTENIIKMLTSDCDGSLPEISIEFANNTSRDKYLRMLLENSKITDNSSFFISGKDIACNLMSIDEIIESVNIGHHLNIINFKSLPKLGVGIFEKGISIDFYTGDIWSRQSVIEFIQILKNAMSVYQGLKITLDEEGIRFSESQREDFDRFFRTQNS